MFTYVPGQNIFHLMVLLYIEDDEKIEGKKLYFGLTYDNQLITRGIDTRRHDSPGFIKEFQETLLWKLFGCNTAKEVPTTGYENAPKNIFQMVRNIRYQHTDESDFCNVNFCVII
jgi:DNA polymerase elongation subunit (family B)